MKTSTLYRKVAAMCLLSGIIAIIITYALILFIFPSGWFFFIVPAFMGWFLTKYCKLPAEALQDEDVYERLSKRMGILCAAMCLVTILISIVPLALLSNYDFISNLLLNFLYYIICGVCVFTGYNRGVRVVADAYYDSLN